MPPMDAETFAMYVEGVMQAYLIYQPLVFYSFSLN